jgi:hypothetical protein
MPNAVAKGDDVKQPRRRVLANALDSLQVWIYEDAPIQAEKYRDKIRDYVSRINISSWTYQYQVYTNLEMLWCMSNYNQFTFTLDGNKQIHIIVTPDIAEGLVIKVVGVPQDEEDWLADCMLETLNQEIEVKK